MLSRKECVNVEAGTPAMTAREARDLLKKLEGWDLALDNRAIKRRYAFKDFLSALAFVNRLADVVEEHNHHPDVMMGWGYAEVVFWTHTVSGLHMNDFIMASKTNDLYADM